MPPSTIAATWHALAVCVVAAAVVAAVGASPAVRHPFEELLRAGGASPVTRDAGSASTHAHAPSTNSAFSDAAADGRDRRAAAGTCVDYTVDGYWANNNNPSVIPARMVARPASISVCELEQLHEASLEAGLSGAPVPLRASSMHPFFSPSWQRSPGRHQPGEEAFLISLCL